MVIGCTSSTARGGSCPLNSLPHEPGSGRTLFFPGLSSQHISSFCVSTLYTTPQCPSVLPASPFVSFLEPLAMHSFMDRLAWPGSALPFIAGRPMSTDGRSCLRIRPTEYPHLWNVRLSQCLTVVPRQSSFTGYEMPGHICTPAPGGHPVRSHRMK